MKNSQKGFVVPLLIAIIALLVIGGGAVYFATKTPTPVSQNTRANNYNPPVTNNNNQITQPPASTGFISPTQGSTWLLGNSMPIKIKTSPQWFHCSNGFYLYSTSNQEIGTVGMLTEPGKTVYNWPDVSKRYATCGTGVGEISISVPTGTYKICLKEQNTETGVGSNLYCSDLFTITVNSPQLPPVTTQITLTQEKARALVLQTWGGCTPDTCGSVNVTIQSNNGQYTVTAIYGGLRDDSTSAQKKVAPAYYSNNVWTLGNATVTQQCQSGRGHQDFSAVPCI